ncbi:flagellar motor protein MotP [Thalassorhabdus alkalitolerans]|uniref:Flagellar motor protein MotP n=1 Tax=Thalassorhabdus alkalitolerans TaxID=2282697 RepID=A0ABW0YNU5_9BACI
MKKLDLLTPIGILLGITTILFAIFTNAGIGSVVFFIQLAAFLIVIGGLFAALLINFSIQDIKALPRVMREVFRHDPQNLRELINTFTHLSTVARREGLLALEASSEDVEDPFIRKGVMLSVDGLEPEVIKDIMTAEIIAMEERHRKGRLIFLKAGEYAPAWGMIGTLVGLVLMLQQLEDPASLGPNMALALITTLYGTILANLVFLPMASKLAQKSEDEIFAKQIVIEGIIGIQSGQNPKILEEKLSAFVHYDKKKEETVNEGEELVNEA